MEFTDFSELFLRIISDGFNKGSKPPRCLPLQKVGVWWEGMLLLSWDICTEFYKYMIDVINQDERKTERLLHEIEELIYPHFRSASYNKIVTEMKVYLFFLNDGANKWDVPEEKLIGEEGFHNAKSMYNFHLRAHNLNERVIAVIFSSVILSIPIGRTFDDIIERRIREENDKYVSPLWVAWLNPDYNPHDNPQHLFDWIPEEVIENIVKLSSKKKRYKYLMD